MARSREEIEAQLKEDWRRQRDVSREIDAQLRAERKAQRNHVKLLLLGSGESGKSTFVKQMRIIHGKGYSEADRMEFRTPIFENIVSSMQATLEAMKRLSIDVTDKSLEVQMEKVLTVDKFSRVTRMGDEVVEAIEKLWADDGVQKCVSRRREFQLSDSTEYYMKHIRRIGSSSYVPTITDVLRVRVPTTGVIEYLFQMDDKVVFRVIDVGGQKAERRKWIHCFDNVTAIIFLVSLIEYDLTVAEAEGENRMQDSLKLFHSIVGNKLFQHMPVIVMFNKTDLLQEKIKKSNVQKYLPDYTGPAKDSEAVRNFIRDKYLSLNVGLNGEPTKREMYPYFTCATDTEAMKFIISAVKDIILQKLLSRVGML